MILQVLDLKDRSPAWGESPFFEAYSYASCRCNNIPLRLVPVTAILPWWQSSPIDSIQSGFFLISIALKRFCNARVTFFF